MGGTCREVIKYNLPETDMKRSLLIIEKSVNTPKAYPRRAGIPAKEPLK